MKFQNNRYMCTILYVTRHITFSSISYYTIYSINVLLTSQTLWKSLKQEGERARTTLKVLETLTYSCTSPQDLYELAAKVERLITDFRGKLPQSEGTILRPEARKSVRKRAQQILKKYRPLPRSVRRRRQKCDRRHRNHVGQKAAEFEKGKVPVHSHKNNNILILYPLNIHRLHKTS